ncbi:unnamed protein product [Candidula unifasciata]|uniref:G-protein coupled receptors family 1 profile domain-containing protein n=1 Tax=Candidula unifasciata TaxID=100452 RepID=A0A8S3ZFV6_9EUPU|nr:unnamed protein product [Candidula unifasciata]
MMQAMADPGKFDFDNRETENKSDVYFSYDHPFWSDYEASENEVSTTFPVINSTIHSRLSIFELNRQKSLTFYPNFIILSCIIVLGVLCNTLVCYIYRCRSRRATSNFFVIFFAVFDMVGCIAVVPLEISALALPYLYDIVPLCKIMGFIETWAVCAQCLTLICVAYDCYRKLCCPEREFSVKKARLCCIAAVVLAVLVSIPALAVFGTKKVKTVYQGVFGVTCSVDQTMPHWLRILYNCCVLGSFTLSLCVMTVLYSLIGVGWCKQRQAEERGEKPSPAKREFPKKHRFVREDTSTSRTTSYSEEVSRLHHNHQASVSHNSTPRTDPSRIPLKSSSGIVKSNSLHTNSSSPAVTIVQLHVKHTRQASIFTVISIIFVVTMLPFVVVMILCATTPVFNHFSSNTTEIVFNLCIRSYLFNYLVKPVAYIIFNMNFRKEVKLIFNTLWSFCTFTKFIPEQTPRQLQRSATMGPTRSASRTPIYRPPRSSC